MAPLHRALASAPGIGPRTMTTCTPSPQTWAATATVAVAANAKRSRRTWAGPASLLHPLCALLLPVRALDKLLGKRQWPHLLANLHREIDQGVYAIVHLAISSWAFPHVAVDELWAGMF